MKNLQEISSLVTNNLKLPPFSGVDEGSKYLRLLAGIAENRWDDETEAREELYGKSLDSRSFDMLKSRAKEHLVNMIFQLDTEKSFKSSYDKALFKCSKNLLAGIILVNRWRFKTAIIHFNLALSIAKKYHFTDLEILSLRYLMSRASFSGNRKQFDSYRQQIRLKESILFMETEGESFNQDLVLDILHSADIGKKFSEKTKSYFETLGRYREAANTYTLNMSFFRVGFRYLNSINDYHGTLALAQEAIEYLQNNNHLKQKIRLGEMYLNILHSSLQLRDYKNGTQAAEQCGKLFNAGNLNWLIYLETYFLLCMQTEHLSDAKDILQEVTSNKNYETYPSDRIEKWRMYEAYLHYIYDDASAEKKKFNLYKFLNEVPIYSRDKAGYNVSILIAQILLLLKEGDYDKILSRAESLKVYISRHVKRENSPRTYYFLKMLQVMIKYEFDPEKTEKIAQKFFDRMQEKGGNREIEEMEVIPYDILWPQVLKMLSEQEHEHIKPVK